MEPNSKRNLFPYKILLAGWEGVSALLGMVEHSYGEREDIKFSQMVSWHREKINIREDRWLKRGIIGGSATIEESATIVDLIQYEDRRWDEAMLIRLFDEQIVKEVLAMPLCSHATPNKLVWTATKLGLFSMKSAYNQIREAKHDQNVMQASSSFQPSRKLWCKIWNLKIPPR